MRIYVGNLPYNCIESEIQELFEAHGAVESVQMIRDRDTGQSKGFGFVEMPNSAEAQAAIQALNGQPFNNRNLTVNEARPRPERSDRGGYGGGGRGGRSGGGGGGWR
ncbi:MAG: RNA-binding protein [Anaerolineae bacterium]|nr:RNA-binding protein [Anaerolineae bacterium]